MPTGFPSTPIFSIPWYAWPVLIPAIAIAIPLSIIKDKYVIYKWNKERESWRKAGHYVPPRP